MKSLAAFLLILLLAFSAATHLSRPESGNEIPTLYWVIDPAPARIRQIQQFLVWQIRNGHGKLHTLSTLDGLQAFRKKRWSPQAVEAMQEAQADGAKAFNPSTGLSQLPLKVRAPEVDMQVDAVNNSLEKKLVQGLSGVCGDIIDTYNGGSELQYLAATRMLMDVGPQARKLGFDPSRTFPALAGLLSYEGRQVGYPRNVSQMMYWVNKDTFARLGLPPPPVRWDFASFEAAGRRFVAAANKGKKRRQVFFMDAVDINPLRRSLGLSVFNETMTRCLLDDPRNAEVLARIRRWTYQDHLLPSGADMASFSTQNNWGGQNFQMFNNGNFGLMLSGRWALIQFRQFGRMRLAVAETPHGGFPNSTLAGAIDTVFTRTPHPGSAPLFLAYLASREYNMQIVKDGDALPPNPAYARGEAYNRPPDHPNEWGSHEVFLKDALENGIVQSFSPFVLPIVVDRIDKESQDAVMAERLAPMEAGKVAAGRINQEISRTLEEREDLRPEYESRLRDQAIIDRLRAAGGKVPRSLLKNPFHQRYYAAKGWLEASR